MNPDFTFHGAVLAGGESRRMGRDKAGIEVNGRPLWRRQCGVLLAAGATEIVIIRRPGQPDLTPDVPHRHDAATDAGPLAGLQAALVSSQQRTLPAASVAVLAVDMPAIDAAWFARLRRHCGPGVGAVACHADGFEPLAAFYPAQALTHIEERLRRREHSLQSLLAELASAGLMRTVALNDPERSAAANWNSPADIK